MLLNDCYDPMVIICCFSWSYYNNNLLLTHCLSNNSIPRIKSITLVYARDLSHCAARALSPST